MRIKLLCIVLHYADRDARGDDTKLVRKQKGAHKHVYIWQYG